MAPGALPEHGIPTVPAPHLLVIQLRQIGDVVLTTPLARILKEVWPACRITFLTERPSDQLLAGNPHIDEVVVNDRRGSWRDTLKLVSRLRKARFDVVIDALANPRSALLSFGSGAPVRIAYRVPGRGVLYSHQVEPGRAYAVEIKKRLLLPLGIDSPVDRPEIHLTGAELEAGKALGWELGGGRSRLATVDPSHRRATRRWPAESFGGLCRRLSDDWGVVSVVLWGPGEEDLARQVATASGGTARVVPPTGLREMAALIAAADLHLGNCSAPRHIAVAVGTPTFTVLGSTSVGWTHPAPEHTQIALGLDCQPCNRNTCDRDFACLTGLGPERVAEALSDWARACLGWEIS